MKPQLRNTLEELQFKVTGAYTISPAIATLWLGWTRPSMPPCNAGRQRSRGQKLAALMDRARNKDSEAVTELNALRRTTIDLYVRAMSNFMSFFRPVTSQPNEQAVCIHTFRNPVNVRYMGQDGGEAGQGGPGADSPSTLTCAS